MQLVCNGKEFHSWIVEFIEIPGALTKRLVVFPVGRAMPNSHCEHAIGCLLSGITGHPHEGAIMGRRVRIGLDRRKCTSRDGQGAQGDTCLHHLKGGAYFFLPGLNGLRHLASARRIEGLPMTVMPRARTYNQSHVARARQRWPARQHLWTWELSLGSAT